MAGSLNNDIFMDQVEEDHLCGICYQVLQSPESACQEGGHIFCKVCLDKTQRAAGNTPSKCPMCRAKMRRTPVKGLEKLIMALGVRCPSSKEGCRWQGTFGAFQDHTKTCDHTVVTCPFKAIGCHWNGKRTSLTGHLVKEADSHAAKAMEEISSLRFSLNITTEAVNFLQRSSAALMEELDDDSDISSEMVSSSSNDYPQAYGSSSTLVRSDDSTSLSMVLASRLPHPSPGPARATTPTVELPWVPCTMVNVAVKPDVQSWGGRKGFITEIMGTHGYKVDIAGETRSLTPGASTVFPPVTVVLTLDQIEATRPVSGDQVVIISRDNGLWGSKGDLIGIVCGDAIVRIGADADDVAVLSLSKVAVIHRRLPVLRDRSDLCCIN